jgi:hypothetical protein
MKVGPIREWPGEMTAPSRRRASSFASTLSSTLKTLTREIYHLADTAKQRQSAELLVAIPAAAFRIDGRPYSNAKAEHPGVIFSMDTKHGHLSYPCDTFTQWEDNLRAIALALEALRKVDRYGVTSHGEQYRGFAAIEASPAVVPFTDGLTAADWLDNEFGSAGVIHTFQWLLGHGKRVTHPDVGGDAAKFDLVMKAETLLRKEGRL